MQKVLLWAGVGSLLRPLLRRNRSKIVQPVQTEPIVSYNWLKGKEELMLENASDPSIYCHVGPVFGVITMIDYRLCGILKELGYDQFGTKEEREKPFRLRGNKLANQIGISCVEGSSCVMEEFDISRIFEYIKNNSITTNQCFPFTSWEAARDKKPEDITGKGICPQPETCPSGNDNTRGNHVTILSSGLVYLKTFLKNFSSFGEAFKSLLQNGPYCCLVKIDKSFQSFTKGIYLYPKDPITPSSLFVNVFGFGQENGKTFWVLLNTWGDWYEPFVHEGIQFNNNNDKKLGGFFRMYIDDTNMPEILYWATPGLKVAVPIKDNWINDKVVA